MDGFGQAWRGRENPPAGAAAGLAELAESGFLMGG